MCVYIITIYGETPIEAQVRVTHIYLDLTI